MRMRFSLKPNKYSNEQFIREYQMNNIANGDLMTSLIGEALTEAA